MEPVLGGLVFQGARKPVLGGLVFQSLGEVLRSFFRFWATNRTRMVNQNGSPSTNSCMHTCIHALHTLHTYIYTYTHCSCIKSRSCNNMYNLFSGGSATQYRGNHIHFHGRNCVPNAQRGTSKAQPQLRVN